MKRIFVILTVACFLVVACHEKSEKPMQNPLLSEYNTPFGVPPFELIKNEHFIPAIEEALKIHNEEVDLIIKSDEDPDFNNTIVALERSGSLLDKTQAVFSNLNSSHTNDELQQIARQIAPEVTKHNDAIRLNEALFNKIKLVYDKKDSLNLDVEDLMLLEETYIMFVRGGANLPDDKKARFREINEELSVLSLNFGQNILNETNSFKIVVDNPGDLSGLPQNMIESASKTAGDAGMQGKWIFTVHKPILIPFITYADNRSLREELFKAYINLGDNGNEYDNNSTIEKMVALRAERAELLGYKTHADFILERNMAKTPEKVFEFLHKIWDPALRVAREEVLQLQAMIDKEGGNFKLEPWDWWYYAEKVRKAKYDIDEETLREYFVLENVRDGAFEVAGRLFGLTFMKINEVPKYHDDVEVFEVKDSLGIHIGILYLDYFPRASKRSGAWMNSYRKQKIVDDENIRPVVTTNFNFSTPSDGKPALISFEEVNTLFHEFGHALHGLLSQCKYGSLSGTSVPRDFVELPSQVMENWAEDPEVLQLFATHYKTGETIPESILEKIDKSKYFNQGFITVEYLSASFLDMYYHTLPYPAKVNVKDFEDASLLKMGMIPEIILRYRSTYFNHIFSGGYSAGYYSYIWAEVLDSDAFQAFKQTGDLFDKATADAFRINILEKGGTVDPMKMYVNFRGNEPEIKALLERRGLLN